MADPLIPLGNTPPAQSDVGGDIPSAPTPSAQTVAKGSSSDQLIPLAAPAQTPATNPVGSSQSAQAPVTPYNFTIGDVSSTTPLKQAWAAAGHDPSQVPEDTWNKIQQQYQSARNPQGAGDWIQNQKSGDSIGSGAQDTLNATMNSLGIKIPEQIQAQHFFNNNVQAREIEKGQNIDANGNYNPPTSRTVGQVGMGALEAYLGARAAAPVASTIATGVGRVAAPAVEAASSFAAEHPFLAKLGSAAVKGVAEASGLGIGYKTYKAFFDD